MIFFEKYGLQERFLYLRTQPTILMRSIVLFCLYRLMLLGLILPFISCQQESKVESLEISSIQLSYANGFSVERGDGFWLLTVKQAYPGAKESYRYLVLEEGADLTAIEGDYDAVVQLPVSSLVMTSTTHIPHLDYLGVTEYLTAFPNLNLISSESMRKHIHTGQVQDLGSGPSANIEMILDLAPDWIMISTLGEDLGYLELLKKGGIPAVINGEYVEQHPLGRAEWIKFTGALLGKWEQAVGVFEEIERNYQEILALRETIDVKSPSVLSGVMYKDIWYMPGADSWGARLLAEAGGNYLFQDQKGIGSSQLSYEVVLDRGQEAEFWIGAADYPNLKAMGESEPRYRAFDAWKKGNVYTYTKKKGETGGLEYFELGYLRPDLIVKDLMLIFYPELFPDDSMYFYQKLDD